MNILLEIPSSVGYMILIVMFFTAVLRFGLLPAAIILNFCYFENRTKFNKIYSIYLIIFTVVVVYECYSNLVFEGTYEHLLISYVLYFEYVFSILVKIIFFIKDNVEL